MTITAGARLGPFDVIDFFGGRDERRLPRSRRAAASRGRHQGAAAGILRRSGIVRFGDRPTFMARRVSWSPDGRSVLAAVGEGEADIVLFAGSELPDAGSPGGPLSDER